MLRLEKSISRIINGVETPARVYRNTVTNGECVTYLLKVDTNGNKWWAFEDLFGLPFIRQLTAKKVLDLYGNGLTLDDITGLTGEIKTILRSTDPEKYDRAMAKVLELETLSQTMADPVRQCMGLCTVYILLNDEMPDTWTAPVQSQKMTLMAMDLDLQAFFLNWWTGVMRQSGQLLKGLSAIASTASQSSASDTRAPES